MINREEHQTILDVAVKYYLEDKTQSEIAKELFISRSTVSRILKKARENRIVDITINYQSEEFEILQKQIQQLFNIENVHITKTVKDETGTLKEVAKVAAKELGLYLHNDITLGISWGRHIGMTAKYLPQYDYKNIRIVELFGAMTLSKSFANTLSVGRKICDKLNATLYPLPAPIYIFDPLWREEVMNSQIVKNAFEKIDECDMIVTSIGAVETDCLQTLWHNYLQDDMRQEVIKHHGVGFILAHFFDYRGKFIDSSINNSVIGIETTKICEKRIFAIASGTKKVDAILGALRGGFLHTLVSDEKTLRKVVEKALKQTKNSKYKW